MARKIVFGILATLVLFFFVESRGEFGMSIDDLRKPFQVALEEITVSHTVDIVSNSPQESSLISKPFQALDASNRWFRAKLHINGEKIRVEVEESRQFLFFFYKQWKITAETQKMALEIEKKIGAHQH